MDLSAKLFCGMFVVWLLVMAVGLLLVLMPVILFIVGFFIIMSILVLLGRFAASSFY